VLIFFARFARKIVGLQTQKIQAYLTDLGLSYCTVSYLFGFFLF